MLDEAPLVDRGPRRCGFDSLIGAGILVRTERKNRQFAKRAAAYRVRAEQGDAESQWALGAMYYYGKGVPKDYVEAVSVPSKNIPVFITTPLVSDLLSQIKPGNQCQRTRRR